MLDPAKRAELYKKIAEYFNPQELRGLCDDLEVPFDELEGNGKVAKARELVEYAYRRGQVQKLVDALQALRPHVAWITTITYVPFVTVAMTKSEAEKLVEGTAFSDGDKEERLRFQQLQKALKEFGISNLESHYAASRDDWIPFIGQDEKISTTIEKILDRNWVETTQYNIYFPNWRPDLSHLKPQFLSDEFLTDRKQISNPLWNKLRHDGCIVIIDSVSLYHPKIGKLLIDSDVLSRKNTAVLVLSPIETLEKVSVNKLILSKFRDGHELAYSRYEIDLDHLFEFCIGTRSAFYRYLVNILSVMEPIVIEDLRNAARREMEARFGKSSGMQGLIFGQALQ